VNARESVSAVVTDLDGTIVRADGSISPATRHAAAKLRAAGIPLVVATARTPAGLTVLDGMLEDVALAVCCNGGIGYQPATRSSTWRHALAADTITRIVEILIGQLPAIGIGSYTGLRWLLTPGYLPARGRFPNGRHGMAASFHLSDEPSYALGICHPELRPPAIAEILHIGGVGPLDATISYAAEDILDIGPPGVNKGTGTARALTTVCATAEHAIAFGDALNDLPMFAVVGHAIAVANAHPAALAAAHTVTGSVEEDGFRQALIELGIIK
jgi:Cof subfamily protein (haloacid dehalogenase superfamily)